MNNDYGPEVTHLISDMIDNKMLDKVEPLVRYEQVGTF